jgi:hypothetical protein
MKATFLFSAATLMAILSVSCSVPGSAVMSDIQKGMSKEQVHSVMQSHGLKPDDSRKRPVGGWKTYGQDPFAAGSRASEFESETGQRVESAEVYYLARDTGASVISLYYDSSGRLIR